MVRDLDCTKEVGYCAALYEGLRCCPQERHIHMLCDTDFIGHLIGRAEPELAGGYVFIITQTARDYLILPIIYLYEERFVEKPFIFPTVFF